MQTRERGSDVSPCAAPEELGGGRSTRPHDGVQVGSTGLLGPEVVLTCTCDGKTSDLSHTQAIDECTNRP